MAKRLMNFLLLLLLPVMLTACRSQPETASVPLRVWVGDNADLPWIRQVIEDFQAAHPERTYEIEVGVQNEGDSAKVVLADVQAAADIFTFADDQLPMLEQAGALMPLTDSATEILAANTPESIAAATGSQGQLLACPATTDNGYFMFCDSRYFSGDDLQTLEGMLDAAAAAGKRVAFPMANGWYLYSFFAGAGLEMRLSEDGVTNVCNWNAQDTAIPGAQVLSSLMEIAAHPGFVEADSDAFVAGLKDGSIIAGVSGPWNAVTAAQVWGDHYAAAKLPTFTAAGKPVQMASFAGFKLVGVNAYSDHVGDAMDLAMFMTGETAQRQRFQLRRQAPSNLAALADPQVQSEPSVRALAAQAPYATVQRVGSRYWDAAATLGKIIVSGNPDQIPLQTLLDNCVRGITARDSQ